MEELQNVLRRSRRLFERGYYDGNGNPNVTYREMLHNAFRRRRRYHRPNQDENVLDHNQDHHWTDPTDMWTPNMWAQMALFNAPQTREEETRFSYHVEAYKYLILIVMLLFGTAHMRFQLSKVQRELQSLRQRVDTFAPLADTIPNFALQSQGARVVTHLSSTTFWPSEQAGVLWDIMFYRRYTSNTQRQVIQGNSALRPGQCWCFPGNRGNLFIALSHPISITHVTLGHITKSQSPHGYITSAPRDFSIYGMRTTSDEGTHLGSQVYDENGTAFQTFKLPNAGAGVFRYVRLQIDDNWGNIDNTCVYSFRVHGNLPADINFYVTWREMF